MGRGRRPGTGRRQPDLASGLIFVDGGTIEPSARPGWSLEQARQDMAPPIFTGFTPQMMRARVIEGARFGPDPPEAVMEAVLANFRVLDDGTIQSNLRRENHLRIIDALWDHRPSQLYPTLQCPVLMLPARQSPPTPWTAASAARSPSPKRPHCCR